MEEKAGLRGWLVERHARLVTRHPVAVLAFFTVLAVLAWPLASSLPLRTGRLDLAPANDASVMAYREFNRAFGALHTVFLLVQGPGAEARAFADQAAAGLAARQDHVRSVIHRLDVERLEAQQVHALGAKEQDEMLAGLGRLEPIWKRVAKTPNVETLLSQVVEEVTDPEAPAPAVKEALAAVEVMEGALRAVDRVLERPAGQVDVGRELDALDPGVAERARRGVDARGYLVSRDGKSLLMVLSPAYDVDEPESATKLMRAVDEILAPVKAAHPGVDYGFAGAPVQDVEEQATVAQDMALTAILAYATVLFLSFLAFRNIWVAVRSNLVLALAVYLTLALANLLVGQLNIISSVFVAVLVGLGDDFGIYLFTMYRDAHARHGHQAMGWALRQGVPGLFTGASTVAAAFLALQLQDFRAFRELGLIAGVGVFVAFGCMVTVLPAVIVLMEERFPLGIPAGPDAAHHPAVEGIGVGGHVLDFIVRFRGSIVCIGLAAMAVAAVAVPRVDFAYDLTQLQSASAKAVVNEALLRDEFGLGSEFVVVRSATAAEAAKAADLLRANPAVGVVSGLSDVVPPGAASAAALARLAERAAALADPASAAPPPAPPELKAALEKLAQAQDQLSKLAKMEGSAPLAAAVARLEAARAALLARLAAVPAAEASARLAPLTPALAGRMKQIKALLLRSARSTPYSPETLPPELRQRYVGKDGSLATYAWPKRPLTTPEEMKAFVDAVTAVPGRVAGLPIMVFRMLELIRGGLLRTALPALLAIVLMVLMDFRDLRLAALGLVPMAGGTLATVGLMGWTGASWNPVNSIALSVMLGVGVDYGVNLVHRYQDEDDIKVVLTGAGRAILYAGATSVLGFGTLMLAQHRGLRSFGRTMALGNLFEMLVALIFLPALLSYRSRPRP